MKEPDALNEPLAPPDLDPHTVDRRVGDAIRRRRRALRISQNDLAQRLGLTFQQVQKYERGANRVSASKLYAISEALNVGVSYFFEDLPKVESRDEDQWKAGLVEVMLATEGGHELVRLWPLASPKIRRAILTSLNLMLHGG